MDSFSAYCEYRRPLDTPKRWSAQQTVMEAPHFHDGQIFSKNRIAIPSHLIKLSLYIAVNLTLNRELHEDDFPKLGRWF